MKTPPPSKEGIAGIAAGPLSPLRCSVTHDSAVFAARSMGRGFAAQLGFDREVVEELVVVVSELTSNILKYGRRGHIEFSEIRRDDGVRGISIVAADETPPFDLQGSLRDGYDAKGKLDPALVFGRGGIGAGLGAIARLSDRIELEPDGVGKRIIVRRFLGRPRRGSSPGF
ncbi:MAG TPA: ATP-binding protein [Labilithrix sp.]|jgi:anti-sigma regulatory factor (Ser/Thr protein kinase)|nr:ATP-binding protein [Labilithrix sp.]